jgi:Putative transmembrane protein (PGPGW)
MRLVKRFAVTIVGFALLALGGAMILLPGPGILIIVAGLAVLATEYVWARRLLVRAKREAEKVTEATVASPIRLAGTVLFGLALAAIGLAMLIARNFELPLWGPVTGGVLLVTGLILLATTYLTFRSARGDDTTYTGHDFATRGAGGSVQI